MESFQNHTYLSPGPVRRAMIAVVMIAARSGSLSKTGVKVTGEGNVRLTRKRLKVFSPSSGIDGRRESVFALPRGPHNTPIRV